MIILREDATDIVSLPYHAFDRMFAEVDPIGFSTVGHLSSQMTITLRRHEAPVQ